MAKRVVTVLVDDLDNVETDEITTVPFSFDGRSYEIDLAPGNREKFEAAIAPYIQAGRSAGKVKSVATSGAKRPARTDKAQLDAMRSWARANGYEVSDRGRLSKEVQEAYHAAS